jgi:protein-disulfide isomerase
MPSMRRLLLVALVLTACSRDPGSATPPDPPRQPTFRELASPPAGGGGGGGSRGLEAKVDQLLAQNEETQKKLDYLIAKVDLLEKKQAAAAAPPKRAVLDPATVYAIDPAGGAEYGPRAAKVTIVQGFEFACPYCQRVAPTIDQVMAEYPDVRVVKLAFIVHPTRATIPAYAYCAAQAQGRHADFEKKMWADGFGKEMDEAMMLRFARELKLEPTRFEADMKSERCRRKVESEQARLAAVGMSGTPAFFINGRPLSGARPIEQFRTLIDEELAKANAAIGKNGLTVDNYYQKVVLEGGKKSP